ncbi:hypothetical protein PhCBS80983_g03270 [Powellomyces hirtus]|uniref:Uncharacterized protein n=1 Tax=Powellomyces hirtus TaxID=109895 RepID=A0A507E324_9FUNG|nr:hypothetical protein PhCBS80983_g03270 [Powellomyces hirtus]
MSSHPHLSPQPVDLLILGLGWCGAYITRLLTTLSVPHAATTTTGRDNTISFTFNPDSDDAEPYKALPRATTVIITFPVRTSPAIRRLVTLYETTVNMKPNWILLGSTRPWAPAPTADSFIWLDRHSQPTPTTDAPRQAAESELLTHGGCILNLAGLYGGTRDPRSWVARVAATKDTLAQKGSLHLIHGADVAHAVLAVMNNFTPAQRWLLTDMRVYDWWDLAAQWSIDPHATWVRELMTAGKVRALPRPATDLGRAIDSTEFWETFGIVPQHPSLTL